MTAMQCPTEHDPLAPGFRFLTDRAAPGMLHAAVLRSPHPHAAILRLDVARARAMPGVAVVATAADIPGDRKFGIRLIDQPVLCEDRVLVVGDPVAAVAAETPALARAALAAIDVAWRELPVLTDAAAALAPGAPSLHPGGNILHRTAYRRGGVEAGFAAAAHLVADTYETPRQKRWLGEFGQADKWISCMTAAMVPRIRSSHDEANAPDAQPRLQGEGGVGRHQG